MPKAAPTPVPHVRQESPANTTTSAAETTPVRETPMHGDGHDLTRDSEPRLRSPQQFYAELTKRPDVQDLLKRLADR